MPDSSWPQPSSEAMELIERVFRLANALRVMEINPGAAKVALFVSLREAFLLLDYVRSPWEMAVWAPSSKASPGIEMVEFDLSVLPQPGMKWGLLFGITLIVEEGEALDTPTPK